MFSIPQQEAEALEQPLRHGVRSPAGNRLESVTNSGSEDAGTFSYTCDSSGNLSFDSHNGLDIQSNVLNLPGRIGTMGGTMTYTYLGDGTKGAAVVNLSAPASTPTDNAILEQNCYTPFGTKLQSTDLKTQAANRWRYAGKEEQNISGMDLGLLDFGARYYNPFATRWNAVDPLAYKYFSMSPYSYCGNDPVNKVDPLGMQPVKYIDSNGNKNISWSIVIMVKEPKPNSSARRMERHETYKQSLANSHLSQFNHYLNGNGEGVVNSSGERVFSTGKTRRAAFITISYGAPDGTESHELFHTTGIGDNGYKSGGVLNSPPEPILPEEIDQMWNSIPWK